MLQVNEDAALLNRHVTLMTPPHFSTAVYKTLTDSGQELILKQQSKSLFLGFLDAAAAAEVSIVVNYMTGLPKTDPCEEQRWLAMVHTEIKARQRLVAKVEHNEFQLERLSPLGTSPSQFGLEVTRSWPWASVLDWNLVK
jgi:hypothetical protein